MKRLREKIYGATCTAYLITDSPSDVMEQLQSDNDCGAMQLYLDFPPADNIHDKYVFKVYINRLDTFFIDDYSIFRKIYNTALHRDIYENNYLDWQYQKLSVGKNIKLNKVINGILFKGHDGESMIMVFDPTCIVPISITQPDGIETKVDKSLDYFSKAIRKNWEITTK